MTSQDTTNQSPLIDICDLTICFGAQMVLRKINIAIPRGQTIAIIGESGCGKTVLSRTIMRLNLGNNIHTSGHVNFLGKDLLNLPMSEMTDIWGQEVAMVFQDPMTSLNPVVKIGRQVHEHVRKHLGASKT